MQTKEEIEQICNEWERVAPIGLLNTDSNIAKVIACLRDGSAQGHITLNNLFTAVAILKNELEWYQPPAGPAAPAAPTPPPTPPADKRSIAQQLYELGVPVSVHLSQREQNVIAQQRADELRREGQERANLDRAKVEEKEQWRAENVTIYLSNGRIDHFKTDVARKAARDKRK